MKFQPAKHEKSQHWPKVQQFYWHSITQYSPVSAGFEVSSRNGKNIIFFFKGKVLYQSSACIWMSCILYSEWNECGTWECVPNCRCHSAFSQLLIAECITIQGCTCAFLLTPHKAPQQYFASFLTFCRFCLLLSTPGWSLRTLMGYRWLWLQTNILQRQKMTVPFVFSEATFSDPLSQFKLISFYSQFVPCLDAVSSSCLLPEAPSPINLLYSPWNKRNYYGQRGNGRKGRGGSDGTDAHNTALLWDGHAWKKAMVFW